MNLSLDATGRRVVGLLIEKETTTPNAYPMTLNSMVSAASQKSNRNPVKNYETFEIEGALRDLFVDEWVTNVSEAGSRGLKWRHRAADRLNLDPEKLAIMAELLLRGSQQPGELRGRANRMATISDLAALEQHLMALEQKGLVRRLAPFPGERKSRIDHCLYAEGESATAEEAPGASEPVEDPFQEEDVPSTPIEDLRLRVADLSERLHEVEERLRRLES